MAAQTQCAASCGRPRRPSRPARYRAAGPGAPARAAPRRRARRPRGARCRARGRSAPRHQVVVQACAGGARRRDQRHGPPTRDHRTFQRVPERGRHDALVAVDLQRDHGPLAEPEHRDAALDRVVRRGRREHRQAPVDPVVPGLGRGRRACREQGGQVGERPPVGEHPARARTPSNLPGHPLDDRGLHGADRRSHLVDRHRLVDGAVDQVGQRGREVGRGHLVRQLAGMVETGAVLEDRLQPGAEAVVTEPAVADQAA
jgi:hypothetical protein